MRAQTVRNFLVAFQALERRRAGPELVAGVALRRAVKRLMCFRERPGRNLGPGPRGRTQEEGENQQRAEEPMDRWRDDAGTTARLFCKEKRQQVPPMSFSPRFQPPPA